MRVYLFVVVFFSRGDYIEIMVLKDRERVNLNIILKLYCPF